MGELLTRFFQIIANEGFVILFLTVGFFSRREKAFGKALYIYMVTCAFNVFLKSLWESPLPPELGMKGWAFPSGHMQGNFVLWAWLAWEFNVKWFYGVSAIVLTGIGISIVVLGFHYPIDIVGAVLFGIPTLFAYHHLLKIQWVKEHIAALGLYLAPCLLPFMIISYRSNGTSEEIVWLPVAVLIGFSLGWLLRDKLVKPHNNTVSLKHVGLLLAMLGIIAFQLSTLIFTNATSSPLFLFVRYFTLAFWLSGGSIFLAKIISRDSQSLSSSAPTA